MTKCSNDEYSDFIRKWIRHQHLIIIQIKRTYGHWTYGNLFVFFLCRYSVVVDFRHFQTCSKRENLKWNIIIQYNVPELNTGSKYVFNIDFDNRQFVFFFSLIFERNIDEYTKHAFMCFKQMIILIFLSFIFSFVRFFSIHYFIFRLIKRAKSDCVVHNNALSLTSYNSRWGSFFHSLSFFSMIFFSSLFSLVFIQLKQSTFIKWTSITLSLHCLSV